MGLPPLLPHAGAINPGAQLMLEAPTWFDEDAHSKFADLCLKLADSIPDAMDMDSYEKDPLYLQLMQDVLRNLPAFLRYMQPLSLGEDFRQRTKETYADGSPITPEEAAQQTMAASLITLAGVGGKKAVVNKASKHMKGKFLKETPKGVSGFGQQTRKFLGRAADNFSDAALEGILKQSFNTSVKNSNSDLNINEMTSAILTSLDENSKKILYDALVSSVMYTTIEQLGSGTDNSVSKASFERERSRVAAGFKDSIERNSESKKLAIKNAGSVDAYVAKLMLDLDRLAKNISSQKGNTLKVYENIKFKKQEKKQ